ncbi:hypothetical protein JOQ06_019636, partial [Pogonophryne albipinna]
DGGRLAPVCPACRGLVRVLPGWLTTKPFARQLGQLTNKNSPIYARGTYPPPEYFILADGGYPCLQEPLALITPYKRPVRGMAEQRFNYHHSRGRSIIERAFG